MPVLPPNAVVDPAAADRALVAGALADQPFAATTAMPPPPIPGGALTADQLMTAAPRMGEIEPGNIDLTTRPRVKNADGSVSTIRSLGVNVDGAETLIPTVSEDGRIMSDDEAVEQYRRTGRHLGKFDSVDASNAAAESLHNEQAAMGDQWGQPLPGGPSLSLVPPPASPAEAAQRNVTRADELGAEQVANATAKAEDDKAKADEEARVAAEKEKALAAITARQETHRREAEAKTADARAKAEAEPFHTFWETRSIGQNVATAIGLILGGVSWNANHENRGVKLLENMMAQDLQLQKEKHADMWRAVEAAEKGETVLAASQLREVARFNAVEAAKHDAVASRLAAAAAMNKGKGDITTAKKTALQEAETATTHWQLAAHAEAAANHQKELDAETARHHAEQEKTALIRANKYKTKGGTGNSGSGSRLETAAIELQDVIAKAKADGKPMGQREIDREAVRLKIPLVGKPNTINARTIAADAAKETKQAADTSLKELKLTEADQAKTVRWKGREFLAPRANQVKDVAKDLANMEKYNDLIQEFSDDIRKNGFIVDPGGTDNPQTEKGKRRMSLAAEVQALGRQISALQATDAGQKLEGQMIGHAGVGFKPGTASPDALEELRHRALKLVNTKLSTMLTPVDKSQGDFRFEGGGTGGGKSGAKLPAGAVPGTQKSTGKKGYKLDGKFVPLEADIVL